jgi:hypothetical protein
MSDSNPDDTDPRYESSEGKDTSYNGLSGHERWILICAIALLSFGLLLLALRSVIFSLILITVGISLFAYWLYVGVKEREQRQLATSPSRNSLSATSAVSKQDNVCTCSICKHAGSRSCLELGCTYCILTRNKQIIGHFNNSLQ